MTKSIAVIGVGRMGSVHAKNLKKGRIAGARLAAVCDVDEKKRAYWSSRGIPAYPSVADLLDGVHIDGVMVAVPHPAHPEVVQACLKKGLPVLCEKPISPDLKSAQETVDCANETGVPFYMMYNQRTNRMYRRAKKLLEEGKLGKIRRVNLTVTHWYRSQHYYNQGGWRASWSGEGGGLLMNQCVHQLDILQWLVGVPEKVFAKCRTVNRKITVENDVQAILTYPEGYSCVFQASGHELKGVNRLEIACEKGSITIGKRSMTVNYLQKSESEVNETTTKGYGNTSAKKKHYRYGLFRLIKEALRGGQQANVLDAFSASLAGAKRPLATGAEGMKALSVINAIYLSASKGREVTLPLDIEEYDQFFTTQKEMEEHGKLS